MLQTKAQREGVQKKIDEINKCVHSCSDLNVLDEKFRVLLSSLDELINLQKKVHKKTKPESTREREQRIATTFREFGSWLKRNDVKYEQNISFVHNVEEGNGLVAARDVKEDEPLLEIPSHLVLSLKTAREGNHALKEFLNDNEALKNNSSLCLAVFLMFEKNTLGSFWAPYLRILPKQFDIALHWNAEEIEQLQGTTQREAIKLIKNTVKQYAYLHTMIKRAEIKTFNADGFTWESFRWGVSVVMSRQNQVPVDDKNNQIALIPLWDMANHAQGKMTTFFEEGVVRCSSMSDIKKGDQIKIFYGNRPNRELLIYQGFIIDNNNADNVKLAINFNKDDPSYNERKRIFQAEGIEFTISRDMMLDDIMPMFRFMSFNMNQLKDINKDNIKDKCDKIISTENEKNAKDILINYINQYTSLYNTSIQDDIVELGKNISYRNKIAIQSRLWEKQMIQSVLSLL